MNDFQSVIDDIQSMLYSLAPPEAETVRPLATAYNAACRAANARLRRCGQMLDQGLRTEALQLCEMAPHLLDVAAALDFPESPQWRALLGELGIAGPPLLMTDVAADINQAYALDRPLSPLLRTHRLLAVARAPLSARIHVLRQIAELDPQRDVWDTDLREYEQTRLGQIDVETRSARQDGDLDTLAALLGELQGAWRVAPPPALLQRVQEGRHEIYRQRTLAEMKDVLEKLNAAFSAFDQKQARRLRDRWNQCLTMVGRVDHEEMLQLAAPVLDWLAEQDQQEHREQQVGEAILALERALGRKASRSALEARYATVTVARLEAQIEEAIPDSLESRYRSRVADFERAAGRRRLLLVGGAVVVVVALAVIAALLAVQYFRQGRIHEEAGAIEDLLHSDRLDEAKQYLVGLEKNQPQLAATPAIGELCRERDNIRLTIDKHDQHPHEEIVIAVTAR